MPHAAKPFSRGAEVFGFRRLLYSPFLVQLVVTRRCNLACAYCNEHNHDSTPVPTDVLRARVDKIRSLGTFAIEFTGGEPLLHPDVVELVAHCTFRGFVKRMLITNGLLLDEQRILELGQAGLTDLQISVDGVSCNARTRKTLDNLQGKLELLAQKATFKVTLNAVIGSTDPREATEVLRVARSLGFIPRVGLIHDGNGAIKLSDEQRTVYHDLSRALGKSQFRLAREYLPKMLAGKPAAFKCRAGSRYLYVDELGKVKYCSQKRDWFSKDLLTYTYADLVRQFNQPKACAAWCTIGCVRNNSKVDELRPQPGSQAGTDEPA